MLLHGTVRFLEHRGIRNTNIHTFSLATTLLGLKLLLSLATIIAASLAKTPTSRESVFHALPKLINLL